ncbi:MAG: hypothetical protein HYY84_02240 [Deltaproteobacteria bacterium]|nr:hypothetical protein [Deltaproteobacteria bacterium]
MQWMSKTSVTALILASACGGSQPPDESAAQAALMVGTWRQVDATTGERKTEVTFSASDGLSVTLYRNGVVDKSFGGTYAVEQGALTVRISDDQGRRMELSSYLAVADDAFAVGFDDNDVVFVPESVTDGVRGTWRAHSVSRVMSGTTVAASSEHSIDLLLRENGTWSRSQTRTSIQNGITSSPRRDTDEGVEWRELSVGRYAMKKTSTSTPVVYRHVGTALATERSLFSRVK